MKTKKKFEISFDVIKTTVVIVIALALALVIILLVSKEPMEAFKMMFLGPFKNVRNFGNIIEMMIPMMFTGLAVSLMFQGNQFNLAAEGSFFIGAIGATIAATQFHLAGGLHAGAAILLGGLFGAIICGIPGILKVKWNASQIVSSLMLNYICLFAGQFIINNYLRDLTKGGMVSVPYDQTALLKVIIPKTRISAGLIIVLILVVLVYLYLYKSKNGFELRMTGQNTDFARCTGIQVSKVIILTQLLGGFIAGIGGAVQTLGMFTRFTWTELPGYGWDGVIVALLARNNPKYIPLTAFFIAYIRIGADIMARSTDVQNEVVAVIQGIIIVLIAADNFLAVLKKKRTFKKATSEAALAEAGVQG